MFVETRSYALGLDGRLQYTEGSLPAAVKPPAVSVRVVVGVDKFETIKLLRRLADEFENQP